jgi:hypothetical protein
MFKKKVNGKGSSLFPQPSLTEPSVDTPVNSGYRQKYKEALQKS